MRDFTCLQALVVIFVLGLFLVEISSSLPFTTPEDEALIISTTIQPESKESWEDEAEDTTIIAATDTPPLPPLVPDLISKPNQKIKQSTEASTNSKERSSIKPEIYSFNIHSDITYRYARTYVMSRVVNPHPTDSQEVTFQVVLPETAFISKFIMEIDGTSYEAYVKGKEEAKKVYNEAQSQGQSAGLVELNTRNTNVFNVNVNIKSQSKVNFNLTYEELLSRRLGQYEQAISITPDQITNVKDFQIRVNIEESQNITLLRVPNLRNDADAQIDSEGNNPDAVIVRPAENKASIRWKPSQQDQNQLAEQGITGKFVVQYEIERELSAGEVLIMNGYFVHFFAPPDLPPLKKHIVFVLDTSGSMWGRRMEQLKEAMNQILADLTPDDFFNIFTFSSNVVLWSPHDEISTSHNQWSPPPFHGERVVSSLEDPRKRQPYPATKENIQNAQKYIESLVASGGTNIHHSLIAALNLTAEIKSKRESAVNTEMNSTDDDVTTTDRPKVVEWNEGNILPENVESLLMFLTDGEATVGETNSKILQSLIKTANKNISVPVFALGFGDGADYPFLRKLALQNDGFARKIYEASDAALQLKGFYNEIASPLLSNVNFKYVTPESAYLVKDLTLTSFPTFFRGTEIAVAGRIVPKPTPEFENEETVGTTAEAVTEETESGTEDEEYHTNHTIDQHYFNKLTIDGFGRDGVVEFDQVKVFCHISCGVNATRPFPPRPTPAPTREDVFLERLWAYLTIKQLIEKDLAEESTENEIELDSDRDMLLSVTPSPIHGPVPHLAGPFTVPPSPSGDPGTMPTPTMRTTVPTINSTSPPNEIKAVSETARQKALRLALKYGFVTSLTSLVVVKPNSTDSTNAEAAVTNPESADSFGVRRKATNKVSFASFGGFTSNRIVPHPGNSHMAGLQSFPMSRPPGPVFRPGIPGPPPLQAMPHRPTFIPLSTTPAFPEPDYMFEEEAPETVLTLDDLSWLNADQPIILIQKDNLEGNYTVVKDESEQLTHPQNCTDADSGQTGLCLHLKDCIQSPFLNDFEVYASKYFCPIKSSGTQSDLPFAGVCCLG